MQKYITGKEILKSYGIIEIELFDLVASRGLQPIDDHGKPLPDPIVEAFDETIMEMTKEADAIKRYMPQRFVLTKNQFREDLLKHKQEGIEHLTRLQQAWMDKKKQSGGSTWHWLRLRSNEKWEASSQLKTLEKATYLRSEVERLLGHPSDKTDDVVNESSKEIYRAAAKRAVIILKDHDRWNILPAKIEKKIKILKEDTKFQTIISRLTRSVNDKTLEKKLREAYPGIWKIGKSSNQKYTRKDLIRSK